MLCNAMPSCTVKCHGLFIMVNSLAKVLGSVILLALYLPWEKDDGSNLGALLKCNRNHNLSIFKALHNLMRMAPACFTNTASSDC